jgi:hypothetical protein
VTADRRQRRAELVRDPHQEVPLELVRLAETVGHLAEAVGHVADLAALMPRDIDLVVPLGNLVRRPREGQDRPRQSTRQVPGERPGDQDAAEQGEREPLEQRIEPVAQLGLRLGDDEQAERGPLALGA